jgi:hypothetical protein
MHEKISKISKNQSPTLTHIRAMFSQTCSDYETKTTFLRPRHTAVQSADVFKVKECKTPIGQETNVEKEVNGVSPH